MNGPPTPSRSRRSASPTRRRCTLGSSRYQGRAPRKKDQPTREYESSGRPKLQQSRHCAAQAMGPQPRPTLTNPRNAPTRSIGTRLPAPCGRPADSFITEDVPMGPTLDAPATCRTAPTPSRQTRCGANAQHGRWQPQLPSHRATILRINTSGCTAIDLRTNANVVPTANNFRRLRNLALNSSSTPPCGVFKDKFTVKYSILTLPS
jgi:hypothetical protein